MRPLSQLILTPAQHQHWKPLPEVGNCRTVWCSARIVLNAGAGRRNKASAQDLGIKEETVGLWRRRWLSAQEAPAACADDPERLRQQIETILADAERPGTPQTFSAEQVCQLLALACKTPPSPLTHWTRNDLAREAVRQGIVDRISATSVGRFLNAGPAQAASDALLAKPQHRR